MVESSKIHLIHLVKPKIDKSEKIKICADAYGTSTPSQVAFGANRISAQMRLVWLKSESVSLGLRPVAPEAPGSDTQVYDRTLYHNSVTLVSVN